MAPKANGVNGHVIRRPAATAAAAGKGKGAGKGKDKGKGAGKGKGLSMVEAAALVYYTVGQVLELKGKGKGKTMAEAILAAQQDEQHADEEEYLEYLRNFRG